MKSLLALCVFAIVTVLSAYPQGHSRGCVYREGHCYRECEEGTHGYTIGCGYKTPEATCNEPNPQPENFMMCDYSACHCDAPTVRDTASGKCVALDKCPKN